MKLSVEDIKDQIPAYLTQEQKSGFIKALNEFPNCNYYTSRWPDDILQGDGWTGLTVFNFNDGKQKPIKGILLSNSCDIDPDNKRYLKPKVTFAPLIRTSDYTALLQRTGMNQQQISDHLVSVTSQHITSMFHLPKGGNLGEDYIAILDDLHSMPYEAFEKAEKRSKLFTLSQVGFYLFLMKLSIHFCRFHENVAR